MHFNRASKRVIQAWLSEVGVDGDDLSEWLEEGEGSDF